jgi:hypothetical protein
LTVPNRIPKTFVAIAVVLVAGAGVVAADDLVFEETFDFAFNERAALEAKVGAVEIRGVEFAAGSGKSGVIKGTFSSGDKDLQSAIVTRLECATTADTKWKLDFLVEFLDADGELIDRTRDNASLKSEAKIVEFSHTTLKWVVPRIAKVRITIEGKGKL